MKLLAKLFGVAVLAGTLTGSAVILIARLWWFMLNQNFEPYSGGIMDFAAILSAAVALASVATVAVQESP